MFFECRYPYNSLHSAIVEYILVMTQVSLTHLSLLSRPPVNRRCGAVDPETCCEPFVMKASAKENKEFSE